MKGGIKPKLNIVKLKNGSHNYNKSEPAPASENLGNPPEYLSKQQVLCWKEIISCAPKGVLSKSDRHLVELAAIKLDQIRSSKFVTNSMSCEFRRLLGEMGMTPAERGRLKTAKPKQENQFDKVING